MIKQGVSDQSPKATIRIIGVKVKEIKVETMGITKMRASMFEIETTTTTTTLTGVTMVTEMIEVGRMFYLKIEKFLQGMVEVVWRELKICYIR